MPLADVRGPQALPTIGPQRQVVGPVGVSLFANAGGESRSQNGLVLAYCALARCWNTREIDLVIKTANVFDPATLTIE